MVLLPFQTLQAGMLGTDVAIGAAQAQSERAALHNLIGRSDVARQLQAMGLDAKAAQARVAALTNEEVHALAGRIDSLPAGADSGWGWAILIAVAVLIWYYYYK